MAKRNAPNSRGVAVAVKGLCLHSGVLSSLIVLYLGKRFANGKSFLYGCAPH